MKLVELKCKNCGASLKIKEGSIDIDCDYCHAKYKLDDEVQYVKYKDMEQAGYEMEKGRIRARKEAYIEEQNNRRLAEENARKEAEENRKKELIAQEGMRKLAEEQRRKEKGRKAAIIWLIIGFATFWPVPLTVLIWNNKKWDKKKKTLMTWILWGSISLLMIILALNGEIQFEVN